MTQVTRKAITQINRFLDVRMGILGAISMGTIVFFINQDHGWALGLIAASKQALYTFFFGALFVKMAENIAVMSTDRVKACVTGGTIPSMLTSVLTYLLHALKGTPEPFNSTLPTLFLSLISFSIWAYLKHRSEYSTKNSDS